MTKLREAAQQALEFCEFLWREVVLNDWAEGQREAVDAALKAALAEDALERMSEDERRLGIQMQPVLEPVAWRWGYRSVTTGEMDWRGYVEIPSHPSLRSPEIIMEPLYTMPPQRKPLTDEEIDRITDQQWAANNHKPVYAAHRAYARAVERAHGIGGQDERVR